MTYSTLDWLNQCNNHFTFSAHVWFGNYVTQRWWNDLWIKESISTYLAADCLAGLAEKFRNSSDSVIYTLIQKEIQLLRLGQICQHFTELKSMAFLREQFEHNHPLLTECEDVHQAESLYDDFLPQKGSAIMIYLEYIVGRQTMITGLKKIVKDFGYKNIAFEEFRTTFESILQPVNQDKKSPLVYVEPFITNQGMNKLELVKII
jgi:aminopeptidase N